MLYRVTELGCAYRIESPKEAKNNYSDNGFKIMEYLYSQPNHTRNIGYINEATGLGMAVCESELGQLVEQGYIEENAAIYTLTLFGVAIFDKSATQLTELGRNILQYLYTQDEYTRYIDYITSAVKENYTTCEPEITKLVTLGYITGDRDRGLFKLTSKAIAYLEENPVTMTPLGRKILKYLYSQDEFTGYYSYIKSEVSVPSDVLYDEICRLEQMSYLTDDGGTYTLTEDGIAFASNA